MALPNFFRKIRGHEAPATSPNIVQPSPSRAEVPPVEPESVEDAIRMLQAIEEVIGDLDRPIELPARVLLSKLPEEYRGPAWKEGAYPEATIRVDRTQLLQQLRKGQVMYQLDEIVMDIPDGWVRIVPNSRVELDLPDVVRSVPPEWLQGAAKISDEMLEVAHMKDFFRPHEETPPPPVAPAVPEVTAVATHPGEPVPVPEAVPATPAVPAPAQKKSRYTSTAVPAWDGVDRLLDAGAGRVDINRASEEELARLPGVGPTRARLIHLYRTQKGPFRSIYDLVEIRGVGRKLFMQMTGLNPAPTKRKDRHEVLNRLLDLPPEARPHFTELLQRVSAKLGAAGCVLLTGEGFVLARTDDIAREADRYAALTPPFFRRARRYFKRMAGEDVPSLLLPFSNPPLLITSARNIFLVAVFASGASVDAAALQLTSPIMTELGWLLGPRAVLATESPA